LVHVCMYFCYCRYILKRNWERSKNYYKCPSKLFKTIRYRYSKQIILASAVDTISTLRFCLSLDEYNITLIILYHPNPTASSDTILEHAYFYKLPNSPSSRNWLMICNGNSYVFCIYYNIIDESNRKPKMSVSFTPCQFHSLK